MIECLLGFKNIDSTENLNARMAGLIPKGIVKGAMVEPEPASLQVRIKGTVGEPFVFLAFSTDGMVIRERSEEHVVSVTAGITNVVVLRAKYLEASSPISQIEVLTLGDYEEDPYPDQLIRICAVTPPTGSTAVLTEHIDLSFRDSIEGFSRKIVREVVDTVQDLPAVSGYPATGDVNFVSNTFGVGSSISIGTDTLSAAFPIVAAINFSVAPPATPGLSRVNPSQVSILPSPLGIVRNILTGEVTITTEDPHNFFAGTPIRITDSSVPLANSTWVVEDIINPLSFKFSPPPASGWDGGGGSVVDTSVGASVTCKTATGVTHTFSVGEKVNASGVSEPSFNGTNFSITNILDSQTFVYTQYGYATKDSGNGVVSKAGLILPENAIEIGESYNVTSYNFQQAFRASILSLDIKATALGSSVQFEATKLGAAGNLYTLAKAEPTGQSSIVLSGANFQGGVDPSLTATTIGLVSGDLYVVLYGESGQIEIWGYDGTIFRNLTSATTATVLDFHRRNLYMNELHLSENEKAALVGSVGTPSATNKYVTQEDSSAITAELAAALQGADNVIPSASNRFLTEARRRGQRGILDIPNLLSVPPLSPVEGDTHLIGTNPTGAWAGRTGQVAKWTSGAWVYVTPTLSATTVSMPQGYYYVVANLPYPPLDLVTESWKNALQFFNLVFKDSLLNPSGPTEYTNQDFAAIQITNVFTEQATLAEPSIKIGTFSSAVDDENGVFPRRDAVNAFKPLYLYLELSAIPDNGKCSLVYSAVRPEKERYVGSDMISQPQTIISSQLQDVKNKVSELTFNKGISIVASTIFPFGKSIVSFPTNLFSTENIQTFKLSRVVGSHPVSLVSTFQIDFQTGTGTFPTVQSFTPVTFGATQVWTKYVLALTPQGKIKIYHISQLLENATDLSEATTLSQVAKPTMPFVDGSFIFATMGVQSTGAAGTAIEDLVQSSLELFPYQSTNSKDYSAPIVCGDGVSSFGHFTGVDALVRALEWASSGSTIKLQVGTYQGNAIVEKDDITIDGTSGALLSTTDNSTALTVLGSRFKGRGLRFDNCSVAIDLQGGADACSILEPWFGTLVGTRIKAPGAKAFTTADVDILNNLVTVNSHGFLNDSSGYFSSTGTLPAPLSSATLYYIMNKTANTFQVSTLKGGTIVDLTTIGSGTHTFGTGKIVEGDFSYVPTRVATWTITDGSNSFWAGDFNSPDGIQKAHDAASDGDSFLIYPGTYNSVIWTLSNAQVKGFQSGKVKIEGGGATCLEVYGKYNQFEHLILENSLVGIQCQSGSEHNTFSSSIIFSGSVATAIKMPTTLTGKHYNYHPLVSGNLISGSAVIQSNPVVTVGDGNTSWGDYVGPAAITLAALQEGPGTKILVRQGLYNPIVSVASYITIEGSGAACLIEADAMADDACISITGDQNKVSGFYLYSVGNQSVQLKTIGVFIAGERNLVENIIFEEGSANRIEPNKKYFIQNGSENRMIPHTGAPTGMVSWTVGDGVRSFGDFNGADGITSALNSLPSQPAGDAGILASVLGSSVNFTSDNTTFNFDIGRDLYKYININDAGNAVNIGSFQITNVLSATQVKLTRYDGQVFIAETGLKWDFVSGSKIIVLPGQYDKTTVPSNRNDVDLEAWGAGSDTVILGGVGDSVLLTVNGNRCRVKGFRFAGGTLSTGVAIQVNGQNNTFEANRFETALRYSFGSNAFGNSVYDAPEAVARTAYTVAGVSTTLNLSRADFVGSDQAAIQAAINAASADKHISRVVLGKGTWTLTSTVTVPSGLTIEGAGYGTLLTSASGLFPAFTLGTGGGQTVRGIRFSNFSNSLIGAVAVANVFAYNNWLVSAPIGGNVTGSTTMNL